MCALRPGKLSFINTDIFYLPIMNSNNIGIQFHFRGADMPEFHKDLISVGLKAQTAEDAIRRMSDAMLSMGIVKPGYANSVIEREKTFPTGLSGVAPAAIPHTTSDQVESPGIAIAQLESPVKFGCMDDPDKTLEVRLIFLLAIKDPKAQLTTLQGLSATFQNTDVMTRLENPGSIMDFMAALEESGWQSCD